MAKIGSLSGNLTVEHPNFPELKVYCKILDPVEAMDLFSNFQQYQKVFAVVHPNTNEIIRDENNNIETVTVTNLPAKAVMHILENVIDFEAGGWEGLEGPTGIINSDPKNIKFLFSKDLNIKIKGKKFTQSFPDYIQGELNKELEIESDVEGDSKS